MLNEVNTMVSNSCGRSTDNENANFCEYCGASFRENFNPGQGRTEDSGTQGPAYTTVRTVDLNSNQEPVSFGNWLGTYLLLFIPCVGGLVFFVMLLVWALDKNAAESKRNWARATLVYMAITFVIGMLVFIMVMLLMKSPTFQEMLDEEMSRQYYDLFKDYSY